MKKHIENIQGRLLKEIYLRYSSRSGTSLNAFIKTELKESDGDLELTKNIKKDIQELEQRGLVTWVADAMELKRSDYPESQKFKNLLGEATDPKYQTFKDIYVEVKLTADKGLDHAANYVNAQTSVSNNRWIKILTTGLLVIAFAALIVQMRQCSISKKQEMPQPIHCDTISPTGHSILQDEPKSKIKNDSIQTKFSDTVALKQNTIDKKKKHK